MDLGLAGKIVLVTGASAGIGEACAEAFSQEGCKLIICARDPLQLETLRQRLQSAHPNVEVLAMCANAQDHDESWDLLNKSLDAFGRIDILVNNSLGADFDAREPEEISDEEWRAAFEGKLLGYIRMSNLVLRGMRIRRWGRIINVVGMSGKEPSAQLLKAGAINAALTSFTKSVASDAAKDGIFVNSVNPGFINTTRTRRFIEASAKSERHSSEKVRAELEKRVPAGRFGEAHEVASLVVFLASEQASYIAGTAIPVDGGAAVAAF